jgi:outer membrane protein assembly factor BamB
MAIFRVWFNTFLLLAVAATCLKSAAAETNWPGWRGPAANGHSDEVGLPQHWTNDSVTWKTPLPGRGHSSPIIWGDRIFLTTALEQGRQRVILCICRTDGVKLWEQVAWTGEPETTHDMNGWASASCATDGERVVAFFGHGGGLHCYTVDGKPIWSRDLGRFEGPWGTAASPLIVREMVIQNCDSDSGAFLIAVDKSTGEEIWKTPRPDHRGWSTPVLIQTATREEIVLNGHTGVTAYDPESGKQLWFCEGIRGRGSPTVTPAGDRLFLINGLSSGSMYCVKPGGSGDVTKTMRPWLTKRGGRDLSSPIVLGNTVLGMGLRGSILTAYDARNGKELWVKRTGGQTASSPVAFSGRAFFIDDTGKTLVIDPNSEQKVVGTNALGTDETELFRASITPCRGQLFIRSDQYLYCVGRQAGTN